MADAILMYNLLKEIFLLLDDGDRHILSRFNLTVPRYYILWHLGNEPGISLRRLSELMICDKSNVTRLIQSMEEEGLVVRAPHESDGRTVRLYLTETGSQTREQAITAHETYNQNRMNRFNGLEQDQAQAYLLKLKSSLEIDLLSEQ